MNSFCPKDFTDFYSSKDAVYLIYSGRKHLDDLERLLAYWSYNKIPIPRIHIVLPRTCNVSSSSVLNTFHYVQVHHFFIAFLIISRRISDVLSRRKCVYVDIMPSRLSPILLLCALFLRLDYCCVIHNHRTFMTSTSLFQRTTDRLIVNLIWLLSPRIAFLSTRVFEQENHAVSKNFPRFLRLPFPLDVNRNIPSRKLVVPNATSYSHFSILIWGRETPYKDFTIVKSVAAYAKRINLPLKFKIRGKLTASTEAIFDGMDNVDVENEFVSSSDLIGLHKDAYMVWFPYSDISQSGPLRISMEFGSKILIPKIAVQQCLECEYIDYLSYSGYSDLIQKIESIMPSKEVS